MSTIATDPDEFERFYLEHLPFVRSYLARRVDDPFVVADLTADVFLGVIRSAKSYRRDLGPPRPWLTADSWTTTPSTGSFSASPRKRKRGLCWPSLQTSLSRYAASSSSWP